jgi:hypothetical protein
VDKKPPQLNLCCCGALPQAARPVRADHDEQAAILSRQIDFNGQRYTVGLPVNSTVNWKALRLATRMTS